MKKTYLKPIMIGFLSVYFTCMLLLTYIVQAYYGSHFSDLKFQLLDEMAMNLRNSELSALDGAELNKELQKEMSFEMNRTINNNIEKYVQYSAAVYGPSGKLYAKTANLFGAGHYVFEEKSFVSYYPMEDYLTKEELEIVTQLYQEESNYDQKYPYRIAFTYEKATSIPVMINITEKDNQVFYWKNREFADPEEDKNNRYDTSYGKSISSYFSFPYLNEGKTAWEEWNRSEKLQGISESKKLMLSLDEYNEYYSDAPKEVPTTTAFSMNADIMDSSIEPDMFTLQLFQESHPWKAAFSSLIHIYIYGLLLVIVCVIKSHQVTIKVHEKQQSIEKKKNRATQAIASKFHGPINDIHRHITNMQTDCYEDKEEELERIIVKTEEMDGMIKELITIAKDED